MRRPRPEILALLALCLVAAALRFATLGTQSFDYDESFSVGTVLDGSLGHVLRTIPRTESTPPLWYLLAWLWTRVFGLSPFGIRSLSALAGVALVPVAWTAARRLASPGAGLIAAALVAANPLLVWYSQEARSYALLALLSGLSFLAFLCVLDEATPRRVMLWMLGSAAALLTHYFAVFLVAAEAVWLLAWAHRQRALEAALPQRALEAARTLPPPDRALAQRPPGAARPRHPLAPAREPRQMLFLACTGLAVVGGALVPLLISQADNRTQWIERLSLGARLREVAKKWLTGEISPTHGWQLALFGAVIAVPTLWALRSLDGQRRRGLLRAVGPGAAALALPLLLDVAGLHYLISKNVMPALVVLLLAAAVLLSSIPARAMRLLVAGTAIAFFLGLAIDDAATPALQRPDYRAAARALGPPARDQAVVTPNLGWAPLALYRPHAEAMPSGFLARQVVFVDPLPRPDEHYGPPATPRSPAGFAFAGRVNRPTYTLICFVSPVPHSLQPQELTVLTGSAGASAQAWPAARLPSTSTPCRREPAAR